MDKTPIETAVEVLGGQGAAARALGVTQPLIWQWCNGRRPVPAHRCIAIERATNGAVTRYELRPDVFGPPAEPIPPLRRTTAVKGEAAEATEVPVLTPAKKVA